MQIERTERIKGKSCDRLSTALLHSPSQLATVEPSSSFYTLYLHTSFRPPLTIMRAVSVLSSVVLLACSPALTSPVTAPSGLEPGTLQDETFADEGVTFVPTLAEHEVHLKAIMEDAYTPEALAKDSLANPQFTDPYYAEGEHFYYTDVEGSELEADDGLDDIEDFDWENAEDVSVEWLNDSESNSTALETRQSGCPNYIVTRAAANKGRRVDFLHKQLTVRTVLCYHLHALLIPPLISSLCASSASTTAGLAAAALSAGPTPGPGLLASPPAFLPRGSVQALM